MKKLINREQGFSLVQLLVAMSIFVVIMAIGFNTFTLLLNQAAQQNKMTEGQVERIVGLEMLRSDIEKAGYGLPWSFQNPISYQEALITYPAPPYPDPTVYNDAPGLAPRAVLSGNNKGINGSDYLVLKATAFGSSVAASKWSYITYVPPNPPVLKSWVLNGSSGSDFVPGDQVIVIAPQVSDTVLRQLVMSQSTPYFYTTYNTAFPSAFSPVSPGSMYLIYGVESTGPLRMPFNRVDYFIAQAPLVPVPSYCAPNTGELVRAYVSHVIGPGNGNLTNPPLPVLDCVADMQIIFQCDTNGDGNLSPADDITVNGAPSPPPALTAQQIAQQVKEIDVYILTHEGRADPNFTYPTNTIMVGTPGYGSTFNLQTMIGAGWQNYRWKVLKLAIKPRNLY